MSVAPARKMTGNGVGGAHIPAEGAGGAGRGLHADLYTPDEAVHYLRLDEVCESMTAALERLNRLGRKGRIVRFRWGKSYLWHRASLDAYVTSELAAELAKIKATSAIRAEGNGAA